MKIEPILKLEHVQDKLGVAGSQYVHVHGRWECRYILCACKIVNLMDQIVDDLTPRIDFHGPVILIHLLRERLSMRLITTYFIVYAAYKFTCHMSDR